jgi:hypothetical protein
MPGARPNQSQIWRDQGYDPCALHSSCPNPATTDASYGNYCIGAGPESLSVTGHITTAVRLAPRRLFVSAVQAVDMAQSIFRAAWWPIHVAVAWALTRDRTFVQRSSRVKSLYGVKNLLDIIGRTPTEPHFEGIDDVWSALREEMAAGKVRASGTPFRRVANLRGHATEINETPRDIRADEIEASWLQDDSDNEDCLVPEDWRVAHGSIWRNLCGYRNVRVFRDDVLRAFNADDVTAPSHHAIDKEANASAKAKSGPGAKARGIAEAINQLWSNKIPKGLSAKDRNKAITGRMELNGSSIPQNPERAIQRVLKARQSK